MNMDNVGSSRTPISPVQLPANYSAPDTGRISGTPGNNTSGFGSRNYRGTTTTTNTTNTSNNNENGYGEGVTAHSKQLLRNAFAQLL